ncbi:4726_t:CDS:2, partial [Acaulospora colombiana]
DLSNSVVDQQNNADTKTMEGIPKVSDKEIDDFIPEESMPKMTTVTLSQPRQRYPKSLEEKEIDFFLNSENKKMFSNLMRERNREKKLGIQEPQVISPTSSEEESSTFEASNVHNSLRIEKEKQNKTSMEHSANIVSDISNPRSLYDDIKNSSFDIQIPEFPLEMILMGSNKITTQNITGLTDLFNVAIKVGQKENLC